MSMKLELLETKTYPNIVVDRFLCGVYEIKRKTYKGEDYEFSTYSIKVDVSKLKILKYEYLPDIYSRVDDNENLEEFVIQTTSYGVLNIKETDNLFRALNHAMAVVHTLNKEFAGKEA